MLLLDRGLRDWAIWTTWTYLLAHWLRFWMITLHLTTHTTLRKLFYRNQYEILHPERIMVSPQQTEDQATIKTVGFAGWIRVEEIRNGYVSPQSHGNIFFAKWPSLRRLTSKGKSREWRILGRLTKPFQWWFEGKNSTLGQEKSVFV